VAVSRHGDTPDKIDNFCQAGQSRLNHKPLSAAVTLAGAPGSVAGGVDELP